MLLCVSFLNIICNLIRPGRQYTEHADCTTFRYDGTIANDLPWVPGNPAEGSNTLVRTDGVYVIDTSLPIWTLICKKPAAYSKYDACSNFTTCS